MHSEVYYLGTLVLIAIHVYDVLFYFEVNIQFVTHGIIKDSQAEIHRRTRGKKIEVDRQYVSFIY